MRRSSPRPLRRLLVQRILPTLSISLVVAGALAWPATVHADVIAVARSAPGSVSESPGTVGVESLNTDFVVEPSIEESHPAGPIEKTEEIFVACVDLFTGEILPNCDVQLDPQAVPGSGGHVHHDQGRPDGSFKPSSGNTGSDGFLKTVYTAPIVSGIIETTITGTTEDGTPLIPTVFTIGVRLTNIVGLPIDGPGFRVLPSTGHDNFNRFARQDVALDLAFLPTVFFLEVALSGGDPTAVPELVYTSIGLPLAGVFDVDANEDGMIDNLWRPPHLTHRDGTDADLRIRNIPPELRDELETAILNLDFGFPANIENPDVEGASHWHLTQ